MSFGTHYNSQILHEAIKDAYQAGILLIGAAGNDKGDVMYPAAYPEVMAVGASDSLGRQIEDMAKGKELEILAPGDKILVSSLFDGALTVKGTSVSAAQVSAAASLIWGKYPYRSADFIRKLIVHTAQNTNDHEENEIGILDVENAILREAIFANYYRKTEDEYPQMEHRVREAGIYETDNIVDGLWQSGGHEGDINAALPPYYPKETKDSRITCLRTAAVIADSTTKDEQGNLVYKDAIMLHGGSNFLAGLRFLYTAAYMLKKKGNTAIDINEATNILNDAGTNAGWNNLNEYGTTPKDKLFHATKELLSTNLVNGVSESSGEMKAYKIMGFVMHLVGDLNAHRVMVPANYVSEPDVLVKS